MVGGQAARGETDDASHGTAAQPGLVSSIQSGAVTMVETTKEYLAAAQKIVEPHVEHAKGVAQGYLGTAGTQGDQTGSATPAASSNGRPAKSAPS